MPWNVGNNPKRFGMAVTPPPPYDKYPYPPKLFLWVASLTVQEPNCAIWVIIPPCHAATTFPSRHCTALSPFILELAANPTCKKTVTCLSVLLRPAAGLQTD